MPRRDFLYEIKFWEARRIIRGYRRRKILQYQLQRIQIWASMFCMGNPNHVLPDDILHLYFDDDDETNVAPIDPEEVRRLQQEMAMINARLEK